MNTYIQWSKREACFACATRRSLAVNHNTNVTSGEKVRCSKRVARLSELGSFQSNLGHSRGYERLQKTYDSLKVFIENVILKCTNVNVACIIELFGYCKGGTP